MTEPNASEIVGGEVAVEIKSKQRMAAFATFLERSPQAARARVTMLQITPKSRSEVPEYARMQRDLEEEAGRINGKLGDVDWTPLRYINKTMSRSVLAGLYRMSRIGLVTPLRDGMNLVAKEYVASQAPDNPGVLVLSQFAGAAQELKSALIVNPYNSRRPPPRSLAPSPCRSMSARTAGTP